MKHVDEGALLALVDGELRPERAALVTKHLEECDACREDLSRLREAGNLFTSALEEDDAPAPVVSELTLRAVRRRAGASADAPRGRGWRGLPRAAVLVLGFAAAASATIPGSPVNRWIRDLVQPQPTPPVSERVAEAPTAAPAAEESGALPDESGVSVLPAGGAVEVVLHGATAELTVKAVLVEHGRAGVYATGRATSARFSTAPGRIEVSGAERGELRVELPRSARVATVDVNGRRYLAKDGDQLRLTVPVEARADAEVLFRVQQ